MARHQNHKKEVMQMRGKMGVMGTDMKPGMMRDEESMMPKSMMGAVSRAKVRVNRRRARRKKR